MKQFLSTLFLLLLIPAFALKHLSPEPSRGITISGAFALYPMAVKWAEEYKKLHPDVRIDISAGGAGKGMTDVLSGMADIGLISRDINSTEVSKGAFMIAVTKDAVVPTINAKHPLLNDIMMKGVRRDALVNLWITERIKNWGQVMGIKSNLPVHVYTRSDASGAAETWAHYLGKKQEDLLGVGVFGDPGLVTAIKKDPAGIGYNNIVYVYDQKTKKQANGVRILPIDLNNNGKIDSDENFYSNMDTFRQAVTSGKYPSPPARDLYFVTKGKPADPAVREFIKFVLSAGQKYVDAAGYIRLSDAQVKREIERIK